MAWYLVKHRYNFTLQGLTFRQWYFTAIKVATTPNRQTSSSRRSM